MQVFGKERLRAWKFEFFILMNSTLVFKTFGEFIGYFSGHVGAKHSTTQMYYVEEEN